MVLIKNVKFSPVLIFRKVSQKNVFDNILQNKKSFKDYKNDKLKKTKNWDFSKGVSPWFWSKCEV